MGGSPRQLVFLSHILLVLHLVGLTFAQPDFLYYNCTTSDNFTSQSTYRANLNSLLSSLSSNTDKYGFYKSSTGQNSDRVNAIVMCRGDVGLDMCRSCVDDSTSKLTQVCPNQKEAIGWYDNCMLRYSNQPIFGTFVWGPAFYMWNLKNVTSDVNRFNQVLTKLLNSLRNKAAFGTRSSDLRKYFATGESPISNSETLYALVQCTPDLSENDCSDCLTVSAQVLPDCCDGRIGGRVYRPSCNLRYEMNRFYKQTAADIVVSSPPDAPPLPSSDPPWHSCFGQDNYSPVSTFNSNLNDLIKTLSTTNVPSIGSRTSTIGQGQSYVSGMVQCRGDVSSTDCNTCVVSASKLLRQRCPRNKGAIIWFDNCLFKYSNNHFLGEIDDKNWHCMGTKEKVDDPKSFDQETKSLLDHLALEASDTQNHYASREQSKKLYGLVQCTGDLSGSDCKECLDGAISRIPGCCDGKQGGRVVTGSCYFRYEIYPFFND